MIFSNAVTTIKRDGFKWRGVAFVDGVEYKTREKYKRPDEAQRAAVTLALQHGAEIDYAYQEMRRIE